MDRMGTHPPREAQALRERNSGIDWVLLNRMRRALDHQQELETGIDDPDLRADYYRELVWLGYAPTAVTLALGWNAKRLQASLRNRAEPRTPAPHLTDHAHPPTRVLASHVHVDVTDDAVLLDIDGHHYAITDTAENLLVFGRLAYGAAAAHHEEMTA